MLPYDAHLKSRARELRNRGTLAEVLLWRHLKGRQRCGYDFHRQRPIDRYIVDFFAPKLGLAIEIDGDTHRFKGAADEQRQRRLEALGVRFLRFGDREVKRDAWAMAQVVDQWIEAWERNAGLARRHTPPCGHPSREGTSAANRLADSPLERGGAERRGV